MLAFGEQPSNEELGLILSDISSLSGSRAGVYAHVNLAQSLICFEYAASKTTAPNQDIVQLLNKGIQQAKELQDLRAQSYANGHLGQV